MQIGADGVACPDDDVFGVDKAFRVYPCRGANGEQPCGTGAFATESALAYGGTQTVEECIAAIEAMHQALIAKVTVGHNCVWTIVRNNCFPFACDFIQGFIPGYTFELFAALGAGAFERVKQAIGMIVTFLVIF